MTGYGPDRIYGYTSSDLRMLISPAPVLAAYPERALTFQLVAAQTAANPPTAPLENS